MAAHATQIMLTGHPPQISMKSELSRAQQTTSTASKHRYTPPGVPAVQSAQRRWMNKDERSANVSDVVFAGVGVFQPSGRWRGNPHQPARTKSSTSWYIMTYV